MGFEVIWGMAILYFVICIVLFAPTLLAVALRRERIFSILAVNYLPSLIGWAFLGWAVAMAWAILGARAKPRPKHHEPNGTSCHDPHHRIIAFNAAPQQRELGG